MLPDGWEVAQLGEVCSEKIVYGIVQAGEEVLDGVPYIKSSDVGGNVQVDRLSRTAPEIHRKYSRSAVRPGDIVFSLRGNTGATSFVPDELKEANLTQGTARIRVKPKYEPRFVRYQLSSSASQRAVHRVAKGSTFTEISLEELRKLSLPLPPLQEQKKIADILSTWDRAIETTGKLLANAEAQKRALMQQLLDQQPWPRMKIGDLGAIRSAGVDKKAAQGEQPVRLLNYTDVLRRDHIYADELDHWVTAPDRQIENCDIRKGDVFFTPSSETRDDIGHSAVAMEDIPNAAYSYHIVRFRPKVAMDLKFRAYAFKSQHFYNECYSFCEGSGQRYVISQDYFRAFTIGVPPLSEQKKIGGVLFDCDVLIGQYQRSIDGLRSEKGALMQQLLTGKRRVSP